jgi:hypothetical protein
MTPQQEIMLFQSLAANQPRLKDWLQTQKDKAVGTLCQATELPQIHRAQGSVSLIDKMLELLDKAPQLRA